MRSIVKRVAVVAALMVVVAASPAAAEQLDAREAPAVEGALALEETECRTSTETRKGDAVAFLRLCHWLYRLDPATDGNADQDFAVVWVQTEVDAVRGWCAEEVRNSIKVTNGTMHQVAPRRRIETDDKKRVTTTLVADGQGSATETGSVTQSFDLYPGVLRRPTFTATIDTSGTETVKYISRWNGSSRKSLAFAAGAEVAWETAEAVPAVTPRLGYTIRRSERCSAR